ncbi:hypothetical protein ACFVW2_07670 [Streptomyces sp. NPDC058171]
MNAARTGHRRPDLRYAPLTPAQATAWGHYVTHATGCRACADGDPRACPRGRELRRAWRAAGRARVNAPCAACLLARIAGRPDPEHGCLGGTRLRVKGLRLRFPGRRLPCPCPCRSAGGTGRSGSRRRAQRR